MVVRTAAKEQHTQKKKGVHSRDTCWDTAVDKNSLRSMHHDKTEEKRKEEQQRGRSEETFLEKKNPNGRYTAVQSNKLKAAAERRYRQQMPIIPV